MRKTGKQSNYEYAGVLCGFRYLRKDIGDVVHYCPDIYSSKRYASVQRWDRIAGQTFIVRHSNVTITKENYIVLQLLELLKNLEHYADEYDDDVRKRLAEYVSENQIKRADIDAYIHFFPDATYRYFYESRLEYVLA